MTASWTTHGRAVLAACLTLLLLLAAPAAAAPAPGAATHVDRLLARSDHKRQAFAELRRERARARAAERREAERRAAERRRAGTSAPPPVGDYGDSTPLDLPADVEAGPDRAAATGGSLGRTLLGLLVVVGLIYALTWALRRMRHGALGAGPGGARTDGLKAVASIPLGPNRSIHLVRAGHEYLLVGAAEHGVVPLRTYTEEEARAAGLLDLDPRRSADPPVPGAPSGPAGARRGLDLRALLDDLRARTVRR